MTARGWLHLAAIGTVLALGTCGVAQNPGGALQTPPPASQPSPASGPAATQPAGPAPRMELSPTKFEFGEVWQTVAVKREFTIKNSGQADLTIALKSTCGCTVATNPKSPLPPGESTTFSITYDSKAAGQANKKVIVTTNDPGQPTVEIAVTGKVKPVFAMSPQDRLTFQNLAPDSAEQGTLKLANTYGRPLPLKLKEGQNFGRFDITLKEVKPGMEYELVAVTQPPLNIGWNHANVELETGAPEVPTITIPVSANAQPRVIAFPPMFSVNPEIKDPSQKVVSVDYRKDIPVKITGIKPSLESIKYELLPDEPTPEEQKVASHKIRLTIPGYADIPADGAKIDIFTDDRDPLYQKLEIRIIKLTEVPRTRRTGPGAERGVPKEGPAQEATGNRK